jgi:peptide/nickel transport system substrate-binding protein
MGLGTPARGPVSDIVWGFAEVEPFNHNMERARELLTEAGVYPDGFETEIWWNVVNTMRMDVAEIVASVLREFNIDVTVHSLEWATYLERTELGESHMFILGWVSVTADIDYGIHPLFHSTMHGPNNRTFFTYYPLDELLDAGREETDPEIRLQIYYEAQQMIRNQAPIVFLRQAEEAVAINPSLQGFAINPGGHHNYALTWFE